MQRSNTRVVILAAGKGSRMKSNILKVMHLLKGRPLVEHVVEKIEQLDLGKPVIVVCSDNPSVQEYIKDRAEYVVQEKQLGTGHAVQSAQNLLEGNCQNVLVLYGDMPFIRPNSISNLLQVHNNQNNILTLMTVKVEDFEEWRSQFYDFGRIVRNDDGKIEKIVEKKDANEEESKIKEVNTSFFCFNADWLWRNLKLLKNNNAQGEYYLTDLVATAFINKEKISSVEINAKEAMGINTKEHLEKAENI